MNKNKKEQDLKKLLKEEIWLLLKEDVNYNFNFKGKKFRVKFDVNSNPTKKGIKIQFTPLGGISPTNPQNVKQYVNELQVLLNQRLGAIGMTVDYDPDVPYENVIGFTLKLDTVANMIVKTLQNQPVDDPISKTDEK
jgi:hypothetical protein